MLWPEPRTAYGVLGAWTGTRWACSGRAVLKSKAIRLELGCQQAQGTRFGAPEGASHHRGACSLALQAKRLQDLTKKQLPRAAQGHHQSVMQDHTARE